VSSKRLPDLPQALRAAKPYIEELDRAGVPYSLTPEWENDTGFPIGVNVGVDAMGCDGWARWIVLPFRDDTDDHGDGFITTGTLVETFERSSVSPFSKMAEGLSECRRSERKAVVRNRDGLSILLFDKRYPF
jgi:hypothetical protein